MTAFRVQTDQALAQKGHSFLLTYGDGLSTIDINTSIDSCKLSGKAVTLSTVSPQAGGFRR
ncbi:MAG: hypothetical protein U0892_20240 [Pirellulales bacterium]